MFIMYKRVRFLLYDKLSISLNDETLLPIKTRFSRFGKESEMFSILEMWLFVRLSVRKLLLALLYFCKVEKHDNDVISLLLKSM